MSTYTTNKNIEKPAHNSYVNTWDSPVNSDWDAIDNSDRKSTRLNSSH